MGKRLPSTRKPFPYAVLTSRGFQLKSIPQDQLRFTVGFYIPHRCHIFLENKGEKNLSAPLNVA